VSPPGRLVDYAGAVGRIGIAALLRLGPRWAVQEKSDGAYVQLHLDGQGRIERALSRSGLPFPRALVGHMLGAVVGAPDAVLVGELEAHTEAGNRAAEIRGWRAVHLFDCIRVGRAYLAREPYHARRDALLRSQSWAECYGPARTFERDSGGRPHDKTSGRFCRRAPRDWQLTPVAEQLSPGAAAELWQRAEVGQAEGLVAVALDAAIGRRRGKLKCKPTTTLDATVVATSKGAARVVWRGYSFAISAVGRQLAVGDVVELAIDGWSERSVQPKCARVVRVREDLREGARP
jgi:ATP-dependent DNA ligase